MRYITIFKIGLALIVLGIVWVGFSFSNAEKVSQSFHLEKEQTEVMEIALQNNGMGYYKTFITEFSKNPIFIQVLSPTGNVIEDKKIETKMAVNYFKYDKGGEYTLKITNISNTPVSVNLEFGDTNLSELRLPGSILVGGIFLSIISSYLKLNHITAQPDENI